MAPDVGQKEESHTAKWDTTLQLRQHLISTASFITGGEPTKSVIEKAVIAVYIGES